MSKMIISFLLGTIRYSTPLLFASLGVLITETAGIVNMGAEGMMIVGCLASVAVNYYTGSAWLGMLAAMAAAGTFGLLFGFLVIRYNINQCVLGIAFNLIGSGLTTTLSRAFFGGLTTSATFAKDRLGFSLPVYLAVALTILIWFVYSKTKAGIKLRSVGENPAVVESVGISVEKLRYIACVLSGILVGMGGAFLSTGLLREFTESMTEGRGFIALAAVTFGKYGPFGTLGGVVVFGLGEMLSYRMQVIHTAIPYEFALMIPYVLTIAAMCAFSRNTKDPAALGLPYTKSR